MTSNFSIKHTVKELSLDCGARLLHISGTGLSVDLVAVCFRAGSRFDPIGKEGLAHYFEHLLNQGSKRFTDQVEKLRFLESKGIYSQAYTDHELASYYHVQTPDVTMDSLDLLIDGVVESEIQERNIEREKSIILDEEARNRQDPESYLWRLSQTSLWPESLLGRDLYGDDESIRSIDLVSVNQFRKEQYQLARAIFIVVSDHSTDSLEAYLNRRLASFDNQPIKNEGNSVAFQKPKALVIDQRDSNQLTIAINYRVVGYGHGDRVALDFIRDYFGNRWISRFNEILRLRHDITYWVDGRSEYFCESGFLRWQFTCQKEKIDLALSLIQQEIQQLQQNLLTEADLETHKTAALGDAVRLFTDPYAWLQWYGDTLKGNNATHLTKYLADFMDLTAEKIRTAALTYLVDSNRSIVCIGDANETDFQSFMR